MKTLHALFLAAGLSLIAPMVQSADLPNTTESSPAVATRAQALLSRAVDFMEANGDKALATFSRSSEFVEDDLYVYVLNEKGVIEASGGASYYLIGRNVFDYRDSEGKLLFQEILAEANRSGSGIINYRWLNMQRGKVERKTTYFSKVGDKVLAVGYYTPRASPEQARSMMWRAIDELNRRGEAALADFNDISGGFVLDDTYVFVVEIESKRMLAHGSMPRLIGRNVSDLKDAEGMPIIEPMLDMVTRKGEGELSYRWRNPATGKVENKHTFVRKAGKYMVGVGYYNP